MELRLNAVSKSYGKNKALSEFSAELTPGVYALLGPNGSGKSTLLNIITDNLKADSGKIYYDGEDILKLGAEFREKLGFMPQYPGLYGSFTAENTSGSVLQAISDIYRMNISCHCSAGTRERYTEKSSCLRRSTAMINFAEASR